MGVKTVKEFHLRYGGGDALEPFYYRILYILRNNRQYKVIKKVVDYYNISPNTQQFGFSSQNLRQELTTASQFLSQLGQIAKSIVALKKDKQRIEECLDYYKKNDKPNENVLKGIWVDFVDSKNGDASLSRVVQRLEFYAAREWFFKINSAEEALKLKDVPDNVREYLARKYREYETWKKHWKKRLEEMYEIIKEQMKRGEETIKLYKKWIHPLLRNVEALKMAPETLNPDLIKIGSATYSMVKLVAWGKVKPELNYKEVFTYKEKDPKAEIGKRGECLYNGKSVPFMPVIEIVLTLRVGPQGYTETLVDFYAKVYDKEDFEKVYWEEWTKDPVEEWIENLILSEEAKQEVKKEKKEEKKENFIEKLMKMFKKEKKGLPDYVISELKSSAGKEVAGDLAIVYFVLKKSFGMLGDLKLYR